MSAPGAEEEDKPQRWLRRASLEACFRLFEIAKNCSYDPEEILEYSIQPVFNSHLLKGVAETLKETFSVENALAKDIFFYLSADLVSSAIKTYGSVT